VAVDWVLFPFVMLVVCLGCGLAVEWVAGWRISGALLPAVGLALVIVAATLTTSRSDTATITTPVVVVLTLAGYVSSWRRLTVLRPEPWTLAVGLGSFVICAAPLVLSGNETFLGYYVNPDTSFHFVLISQLLAHGHDLTNVPVVSPSAVTGVLNQYIRTAYPTGADVALGAMRPLVGRDAAWLYQPYLAVIVAFGAVALHELLRDVVNSRPLRALCAFIAAQNGLAYAFYLEASIKEIATTLILTVTVVLVIETLRRPLRPRAVAPLAITAVAGLDVLALAAVPWLGVPLGVFAVVIAWRARHVRRLQLSWPTAAATTAGAAIIVALAAPFLSGASTFAAVAGPVLTQKTDLGPLAVPLPAAELFGIWPSGDFRYGVQTGLSIVLVLVFLAFVSAILGAWWTLRRRAFGPLLLLVGNGIAAAFLFTRSSPYAAAKVMMIFSTTVALTSMLGAAAVHRAGYRLIAWTLAAALAAGVMWTNALGYHDSSVGPQGRFRELAAIGARFRGQGPAFYDLWDKYPVYFLRNESVAIPYTFAGAAPLRPGALPRQPGQLDAPWDPNDLAQSYLQRFRLLILSRSPLLSRPPADYRLVYRGRYNDVWQREPTPHVLTHVPFSNGSSDPVSLPRCPSILAIGALARREQARLAYVSRLSPPMLVPTQAVHPRDWSPHTANGERAPAFLFMGQASGTLTGMVHVSAPGRYRVWLQGSLSRRVIVSVDGRLVGSVAYQLGSGGQFTEVGSVRLAAGDQPVQIRRPPSNLGPGNVASGELLGPLVLVPLGSTSPVRELSAGRARMLCGQRLEWLEVVR
jgi:hypothetical protein